MLFKTSNGAQQSFELIQICNFRTKRIKYLEENIGSVNIQLSQEELAELRKFIDEAEVYGARASPEYASPIDYW